MTKPPTLADPAGAPSVMDLARRMAAQADVDQPLRKGLERDFLDEVADVARAFIKAHEALEKGNEKLLILSDTLDRASHSESIHQDVLANASKTLDAISDDLCAALTNPASEDTAKD